MKNITVLTLLLAGICGVTNSPAQSTNAVIWQGNTGYWSGAANWNTGVVPNDSSRSVMVDGGKTTTASLVIVDGDFSAGALTIDVGDAVSIGSGPSLTIGTGSTNPGSTLSNAGTLTLDSSSGQYASLFIDGTVQLTGGGVVNIADSSRILGTGTLINVNNTIQGNTSGAALGFDQLTIVN